MTKKMKKAGIMDDVWRILGVGSVEAYRDTISETLANLSQKGYLEVVGVDGSNKPRYKIVRDTKGNPL